MPGGVRRCRVVVERMGATRAIAKMRGHTLALNAEKGRGEGGFNAAETLAAIDAAGISPSVTGVRWSGLAPARPCGRAGPGLGLGYAVSSPHAGEAGVEEETPG